MGRLVFCSFYIALAAVFSFFSLFLSLSHSFRGFFIVSISTKNRGCRGKDLGRTAWETLDSFTESCVKKKQPTKTYAGQLDSWPAYTFVSILSMGGCYFIWFHFWCLNSMRERLCLYHIYYSLYRSDLSFPRTFIHPAPYVSARVDHALKVNPIRSRTKKYQFSPLLSSINGWNALPSNVVAITESSLFQSSVLTYLEVDNNL